MEIFCQSLISLKKQINKITYKNITIADCLNWATQKLKAAKTKSANLDAEILLCFTLSKPKSFIYSHPQYPINHKQLIKYKDYIAQRIKHQPIAYITHYKEFYKLDFYVDQHVLIPRPETELIVDQILKQLSSHKKQSSLLIDVGTGCGNIPISVIKNSSIPAIVIDISKPALAVARKNAKLHKLNKKIKFLPGNLLEPILKNKKYLKSLNLIISANLPYLPRKIYQHNYQNLKYEPKSALIAKNNGLKLYEKLLKQIKFLTSHSIALYLEILPAQTKTLIKLIEQHLPLAKITIKKDLAGLNRLIMLNLPQTKTNPK